MLRHRRADAVPADLAGDEERARRGRRVAVEGDEALPALPARQPCEPVAEELRHLEAALGGLRKGLAGLVPLDAQLGARLRRVGRRADELRPAAVAAQPSRREPLAEVAAGLRRDGDVGLHAVEEAERLVELLVARRVLEAEAERAVEHRHRRERLEPQAERAAELLRAGAELGRRGGVEVAERLELAQLGRVHVTSDGSVDCTWPRRRRCRTSGTNSTATVASRLNAAAAIRVVRVPSASETGPAIA